MFFHWSPNLKTAYELQNVLTAIFDAHILVNVAKVKIEKWLVPHIFSSAFIFTWKATGSLLAPYMALSRIILRELYGVYIYLSSIACENCQKQGITYISRLRGCLKIL